MQKSAGTPKSGAPRNAKRKDASPSSYSLPVKRGIKRSGDPLEEPPSKHLGVSFGPDMSPELFDRRLPPMTPIKRGATPQRMSAASIAQKSALKGRHSAIGTSIAKETENKSPVKVIAAVAASPIRAKRTPEKPFRYRSPTLEAGSVKVRGSKKIAIPSTKRAQSLSPVKIVTEQPVAASPDRIKRTPQKPFRYRSPTLETGSIKVSGGRKTASPPAKRVRSQSLESMKVSVTDSNSTAQMLQTPSSIDLPVSKKGKPAAVQINKSPASSNSGTSGQMLHSTPAVVLESIPATLSASKQRSPALMKSKDVTTTPLSAKKRKSLTGQKSPIVYSPLSSPSRKSPHSAVSLSPARGKKPKSGSAQKTATETTTADVMMTPSRMVAIRAVFGREMTPKLKMPSAESSSSQLKTAASTGAKPSAKRIASRKSVGKQSVGKVASLKKSVRKSTAKKTLWSEVVKRAAASQKSGPKIIKPVIVKAQKMKNLATAVVSILS